MAKTDSTPTTEAQEDDAAGARLSTAPAEDRGQAVPGSFGGVRRPGALGALAWTGREVIGWLRWFWRQLTSMRVALILLLLLSLATIPGSLIPQTSVDSVKADTWKEAHKTLTPIYEKLQLFHVYSSVWFSAIYILLFVSLIGCIVPRTWQFVGQLRGRPPKAPRRLDRLPAYATWRTDADPDEVLAAARRALRRKRFRTVAADDSVASEKGYLREAGNLLFHVSLIVMLVAFASAQLWKYEGGKLVVEGDKFSNTLTQYDDFKSGSLFSTDDLPPFGFQLKGFTGTYERTGPQKGTPRDYRAHISYWEGADGTPRDTTIKVNEPLEVGGSKVYLQGHGYAPKVTIRDGQGTVVYHGAVASLPLDNNITETTVIKVPDYWDKNGKKSQLGFTGNFVPTLDLRTGRMASVFPALDNPVLILTAYKGDLGIDSGLPQSVYKLETKRMKQFMEGDRPFARALKPGETMTLPDGAGSLKFDGISTWATFQISHKPGDMPALAGAVAALIGVAGSLFIQRRRVWVRAVRGADGRTVVELAGLGRSESAKVPEELYELAVALQSAAPPVAEEEPDGTTPSGESSSGESSSGESPSGEDSSGEGSDESSGKSSAKSEEEKAVETAEERAVDKPAGANADATAEEPTRSAEPTDSSEGARA
ncbi:cytochrome c biogenesis protein ResB [Streptomyces mobaraensis NBRC 13819 = DSM 40847]|uniref:Putative cytochrome c biogenesis membrane protein n=1 Tax=Streptomyces mobaraensis (strain ATCC 29032 / DSM 40847 / JCM 4168 / NBRC 13819 / NCIMB 11159 / IPCR 16-22) TaxID=1223523 RepID=M3BL41_STRM1|nr:cytochrome c biogenesis protein ResB [Streptomyces mobaraensis]EMF00320.1 putative cytochrome c biogenesis membrane protein [Streptomyces mobaraensis NBRC 13819 = DSM 40847]QTT74476.1 cytochrome c biogenesis protein ResB [Streptomyces mobaraensis NBRC 13819 = DSM 40847]